MISIHSEHRSGVIIFFNSIIPVCTCGSNEESHHVIEKFSHENEHKYIVEDEKVIFGSLPVFRFFCLIFVVKDGNEGENPKEAEQ